MSSRISASIKDFSDHPSFSIAVTEEEVQTFVSRRLDHDGDILHVDPTCVIPFVTNAYLVLSMFMATVH